jgi:hypothetical protein
MKKILCILLIFFAYRAGAQNDSSARLFPDELAASVATMGPKNIVDKLITDLTKKLTTDPELYNRAWAKIMAIKNKPGVFALFKDLDVAFKTFQVEDNPNVSLGFNYDWNLDWRRYNTLPLKRNGVSLQFHSTGNVAFKKQFNPNDFLTTGFTFGGFQYSGGVVNSSSDEIKNLLNDLELQLAEKTSVEEIETSEEWRQFNENLQLTDQYYVGIDGSLQLENTQDFSSKQWAYGIRLGLGAKGWSENSTLAYFNIPDYPFALLRMILGNEKTFQPDGATIPVFLARLDYIRPYNDLQRSSLTENEKGYARFSIETGFRTLIAEFKTHSIFFNADFRFFKELNAPSEVKFAGLGQQTYFVASVTSSKGFFVSYTTGRLPFDLQSDQVYALGFQYKFN